MLSRVSRSKYQEAVDKFKADTSTYSCHILGSDHVWFDNIGKEVVAASVNAGSECYIKNGPEKRI